MRRILLVEPAQAHLLREEVTAYRERGWEVHVNTFRHAEVDVPREGLPLYRFDPSHAEAVSTAITDAAGFDAIKVRSSTRYGESFFRETTRPGT
ncbi:hypothetical protein [Kineosporia sp. NBRC 101731]|uniref:hypothetical protein n=1 Tax=Kineosporia sp. NBRC 101731 TaxID=3032199 RepID=UPI0024A1BB9E|nr:hypothetical protein [Kineosporia sp. NBRC 101731]GLY28824.1 hypothetical protein Kisp02_21890 [Kineosporia sp. NBRC 101731]